MTEMFGEAWPPMSVPDLAPDDDDKRHYGLVVIDGLLSNNNLLLSIPVYINIKSFNPDD